MREILRAEAEGSVSSPIKDKEARQLLYFQACIYEGLRWFTPIGQLRDRLVPPEGDTILGYKIPGGTHVGLNPWGTQLSKVYGDDPEVFRPERWLINDEERLQRMHQCHELIFGCGPTKCLGVNIAMMEINKALFEVCRRRAFLQNPANVCLSSCFEISIFLSSIRLSLGRANAGEYFSKEISMSESREETYKISRDPERMDFSYSRDRSLSIGVPCYEHTNSVKKG